MKKSVKAVISVILSASIIFSCMLVTANSVSPQNAPNGSVEDFISDKLGIDKPTQVKYRNAFNNFFYNDFLLGIISRLIPKGSNVYPASEKNTDNFYEGNGDFVNTSDTNGKWSLGYARESIIPFDFGEKKYARGSYSPYWMSSDIYAGEDGTKEDLKVRVIVLDDGRGRGSVVFASVDCIGIANADIRRIREAVADFAEENNIKSINVTATHTHSGIDSQGVWANPLGVIANNLLSAFTFGLVKQKNGIDETFRQTLINSTAKAIKDAYADMTEGELFYSYTDVDDYTYDRTPPYASDNNLYRLYFRPDDENKKPTVIATFGCHPESASYDFLTTDDGLKIDSKLSADFVYYMEKLINKAGCNFIYIQGNVGTVTSSRSLSNDGLPNLSSHDTARRFGYELGYITLGMTMTEEQCADLNESCGDLLGVAEYGGNENYTVWYEGRVQSPEVSVEPVLNVRHELVRFEVQNNMALTLTKLALASVDLYYDSATRKYYADSEIGYMEIGSALKVFLSPGEIMSELLLGGECLDGFKYKGLRELYGENLIILDLVNDAIGYVEPDNYYVIKGYQYDPATDSVKDDSWCALVSFGKNTASKLMGAFIDLVESVRTAV